MVSQRPSSLVRHIGGKRHNLGPDEKEAKRKFHELMAAPEAKPVAPVEDGFTLAEVFDNAHLGFVAAIASLGLAHSPPCVGGG